jgi:hypothetical protein
MNPDGNRTMSEPPLEIAGRQADASRDRRDAIVDRWLDGGITPSELDEMQQQLLESSGARREFWRRAALHGLLHEAARLKFAETTAEEDAVQPVHALQSVSANAYDRGSRGVPTGRRRIPERPISVFRGRWFWPSAVAAACLLVGSGVGIGSFLTTLAVAHAGRISIDSVEPFPVLFEGFELPPAPLADYLPTSTDCWSGDETRVVGRVAWDDHRMLPHAGEQMLQFISGHPRNEAYSGVASEIWRFIDLEQLRTLAGSRELRVELSAWFNGTASNESPGRMCGLKVIATQHAPAEVDQSTWLKQAEGVNPDAAAVGHRPVAAAEVNDLLDNDPASWQRAAVVVAVPAHARYLLLHCYARGRNATAFASGDRGPGQPAQYVDDIALTVEPQSLRPKAVANEWR